MGKTKKGTQAAGRQSVRAVQPNAAGSGAGGAPGPDPEANSAPPIFGQPDFYPDLVFIANARDETNPAGFTFQARAFHRASGCRTEPANSIEDIVNKLAAGTGVINRLRIVSHVFVASAGAQIPEANMMIPFLEGGGPVNVLPSLKEHFAGYAKSDLDGLRAIMTFRAPGPTSTEQTPYFHGGDIGGVLAGVPAPANALLAGILDPLGEPADDAYRDFFKLIASKNSLALSVSRIAPGDQPVIRDAYDRLITDLLPKLPGSLTIPQRETLRDGVAAVPATSSRSPQNPAVYVANVRAAIGVLSGDTFASRLGLARRRFNRNSKVDIRGCQIGKDTEFLDNIQRFFGTSSTVRPTVSGPDWFQHFNAIAPHPITPASIDTIATGVAPFGGAQTLGHFNDWANGFGITAAHLSAWTTALDGGPIEFLTLRWAASLPSTAFPITRLREIVNASVDNIFPRLTAVLGITAAGAALNTAEMNSVRARAPDLQAWADTLAAPIPASNLASHLTALHNIYKRVDSRFDGGVPPNPPVIPATESGLTPARLQTLRNDLLTFIATDPESHFLPVKQFMNAGRDRLTHARGRLRLYMGLGIPFLVFNPTATNAGHNRLVMLRDPAGPQARQVDAVRYWLRAQWQGLVPDDRIGLNATFPSDLHTPWLVEHHQSGLNNPPFAVSPTPQYHAHIVTRPA